MARALVAVAWLVTVASVASAADVRAVVTPYLDARSRGALGQVSGDVFAEPRAGKSAPTPHGGVSIMLLPASAELATELDGVKRAYRDSASAYAAAAGQLAAMRSEYERGLMTAGGGELVRGEVSDELGRFRFAEVPAGRWLLLAWREVSRPVSTRKVPGKEATDFRDNWERTGYVEVSYWRMEVDVRAGETAHVSLFDRNGWLTVVREEQRLPSDARKSTTPKHRQGTTR